MTTAHVPGEAPTTPRLGIVRPSVASTDRLVADAEARVVTGELVRRLGPLTFDLRSQGALVGPWLPRATAAWPVAVDAELDLTPLWSDELPPLTTLFGRTVPAAAIEPRTAMLVHLGVVPDDERGLDQERFVRLRSMNVSPTDLWLIAQRTTRVATTDRAIAALATPVDSDAHAMLDAAFDALAASCVLQEARDASLARVVDERDDLARNLASARVELDRVVSDTNRRFAELERERAILLDRLERADADAGRPAAS